MPTDHLEPEQKELFESREDIIPRPSIRVDAHVATGHLSFRT
jgi:hypothetical protein